MTTIQEICKYLQETFLIQEMKLLIFLKQEFFCIKVIYLKKKEKEELEENKFFKYIKNEKGINYELFEKHFSFTVPTALVKNYLKQKIKRRITTQ